jgi:hypothetical protein
MSLVQGRRLVMLLAAACVGAVFIAGLFTHGLLSGLLLIATALVLIGLAAVTWPRLRAVERGMRLVVIVAIAAIAIARLS